MNDEILKYRNLIYKVMNKLHCSPDDETQDEMFFEGLLGLYRGIETYRDNMKVKKTTYYYVCIRNAITTKFNYNTRTKRDRISTISFEIPLADDIRLEDTIASEENLEQDVIQKEQLDLIYKILNESKNTRCKQYIYEFYGIGMPKKKLREIAQKYGVSIHNVSTSLRQGIGRLKKKVILEYERKNKKDDK